MVEKSGVLNVLGLVEQDGTPQDDKAYLTYDDKFTPTVNAAYALYGIARALFSVAKAIDESTKFSRFGNDYWDKPR